MPRRRRVNPNDDGDGSLQQSSLSYVPEYISIHGPTAQQNSLSTTTRRNNQSVRIMVAAGIFCGGMICAYNANHDVPKYNPSEPIQRSQSNEWKQKCFSWNQSNSNVDEWWAQHPDWEITSETDSNFCFKPIANQEKAVLFKTLHEIGFQHNCSDVFTKSMPSAGWNGDFDKIRDGLMFSLETNRPFQTIPRHGAWHYASRKNISVCPSKDLFCYFLDISQCKPEDDPQHLEHWYMAKNNTNKRP